MCPPAHQAAVGLARKSRSRQTNASARNMANYYTRFMVPARSKLPRSSLLQYDTWFISLSGGHRTCCSSLRLYSGEDGCDNGRPWSAICRRVTLVSLAQDFGTQPLNRASCARACHKAQDFIDLGGSIFQAQSSIARSKSIVQNRTRPLRQHIRTWISSRQ